VEHDTEYDEGTITDVRPGTDGWEITWQEDGREGYGGLSFWCPDNGVEPKVGSRVRFYGRGFGYPVRGLVVDGQTVFYRTEKEQRDKWRRENEERERLDRETYAGNLTAFDDRVAALPEPFRDRIAGFRDRNPDWGWRFGEYELMCCEQAVVIADALQSSINIAAFHKKDWDTQRAMVPGLDDGHSGNTFGCSCRLAATYLDRPEIVPHVHGAMCPLTGCRDYGCWATTQQED
jgi:hypothetical protein